MSILLEDIETANSVGNSTEVNRIAKRLSTKQNGKSFIQPSVDNNGNIITSTDEQLEAWAVFLEEKFSARSGEQTTNLEQEQDEETNEVPEPTRQEIESCIKTLKKGKATGPDDIPIEQYKASETATTELLYLIQSIWREEVMPEDFVLAEMMMHYKKKSKDNRSNYRALALLNHTYKIFAMVLLIRMVPYIDPKLSDMQAGFRKSRGCRDNILILVMTINHLLESAKDDIRSRGIVTYIDFTAAFDSIAHPYLLDTLKQYGVPLKYCRLVKSIYDVAAARVRLQEPGGTRSHSRRIPIKRGALQGDIPSAECFIATLDRLLKEHGSLNTGIQVTAELLLSELAFADDAALPTENTVAASSRLTTLDENAKKDAGMVISITKTKAQHIRKRPKISNTTEEDIRKLPPEKQLKFECDKCGYTFANNHGLRVHQGRWCKKRKTKKRQNRKGTVADRLVARLKVEEFQKSLDKVCIGGEVLENVYSFQYLGAEVAGDGDPMVTVTHRCNIAWGRFSEFRKTLTSAKLPVGMRLRLYSSLIISTMTYGCCAWLLTEEVKRKVNGVNSKMLAQITRRSIHEEARSPSVNIIEKISKCRWEYLGHILRMDENRAVRRYLLELSPSTSPFKKGTLLADTKFNNVLEMVECAANRNVWRNAWEHLK